MDKNHSDPHPSMEAGRHVETAAGPRTHTTPPSAADQQRTDLLTALRAAAATAGRRSADRWAKNILTAPSATGVLDTARRTLDGIDNGDHTVVDSLLEDQAPGAGPGQPGLPFAPVDDPAWSHLTAAQRHHIRASYRHGLLGQAARWCRIVLGPTGDGRDLSHLHPDQLCIGNVAVFARSGAWIAGPGGEDRVPTGFLGVLTDVWNGHAVFDCTRSVAEAIVADHNTRRDRLRAQLIEQGCRPQDADREVDESMGRVSIDGDVIVVDERDINDDPNAVDRIEPDGNGCYDVMGRSWAWQAVDPYDCDRIVGEIPEPDRVRRFAVLPHTGMRVPHDRLRVTARQPLPNIPGAFRATMALDDEVVGEIVTMPGERQLSTLTPRFSQDVLAAYVAGCRLHDRSPSQVQVLQTLVTEYEHEQAAHRCQTRGGVLTRLVDADGRVLRLRPVWPAPDGFAARKGLGRRLRRHDRHPRGQAWQWWDGAAWLHLTNTAADDDPPRDHTLGQLLAYLIADALLDTLDRDRLVQHAASNGIPLEPDMDETQVRAALRGDNRDHARQAGMPVDDLPTLAVPDAFELGRLYAGGHPDSTATPEGSPSGEPDAPARG